MTMRMRRRGFTTVELLIVMVAIAILAAVALPSYLNSIRKGHRSDAFSALSQVQQAEERWRGNNSAYTADMSASGIAQPTTSQAGYYAVEVASDSVSGSTYEATAKAIAGTTQANDTDCTQLGVKMNNGTLTYAGTGPSGTLIYGATNPCWVR